MCNLRRLERNCCRRRQRCTVTWMSLKPVGSAGEENCLAIAVRLGCEVSRLALAALGGEERLLDGARGLREKEETVGDVVCPYGEGRISVIDGFGAR